MQLIKTLFSNPTALIVLFSILVTGLLIIRYFKTKEPKQSESGFKTGIIVDAKLSGEFEERRMRALNDSGIHADDFASQVLSELEVQEG